MSIESTQVVAVQEEDAKDEPVVGLSAEEVDLAEEFLLGATPLAPAAAEDTSAPQLPPPASLAQRGSRASALASLAPLLTVEGPYIAGAAMAMHALRVLHVAIEASDIEQIREALATAQAARVDEEELAFARAMLQIEEGRERQAASQALQRACAGEDVVRLRGALGRAREAAVCTSELLTAEDRLEALLSQQRGLHPQSALPRSRRSPSSSSSSSCSSSSGGGTPKKRVSWADKNERVDDACKEEVLSGWNAVKCRNSL